MVGSLTPQHHVGEVSSNATKEGLINGAITLLPSSAAVWALMKNPSFVRVSKKPLSVITLPTDSHR